MLLRSRHLQYMLQFSYWPQIAMRDPSHIYEMRSYRLKPGTMIEWGNNWARGINFRKTNDVAFAGFFSQIGRLYNVHHIWCKFRFCFDKLTKFLIFNLTSSNSQAINHFKIVRKVVKLLGVHQDGMSVLHTQYH